LASALRLETKHSQGSYFVELPAQQALPTTTDYSAANDDFKRFLHETMQLNWSVFVGPVIRRRKTSSSVCTPALSHRPNI